MAVFGKQQHPELYRQRLFGGTKRIKNVQKPEETHSRFKQDLVQFKLPLPIFVDKA